MKTTFCRPFCLIASFVLLTGSVLAQPDSRVSSYAPWNLLESPYAPGQGAVPADASIHCSIAFPDPASMYGLDVINPHASSHAMIANELFSPFRVFEFDDDCHPLSTVSTAFTGTTMAGVLISNSSTAAYWVVNPTGPQLEEFVRGSGEPTGTIVALLNPPGAFYGDGVVDSNEAGDLAFVVDFVNDVVVCVDLATHIPVCSFANPDGPGAFGQGIGDVPPGTATDRSRLILPSGTSSDGRPVRVSRIDCSGMNDRGCDGYGAIDLTKALPGTAFICGIASFMRDGTEFLGVVDNTDGIAYLLAPGAGGSFGTGSCARPSYDPNGWWHLDETSGTTSADQMACSDGNHVGAPVPTTGKVSGGLSFAGTDAVLVPHQPCLDFGAGLLVSDSSSFTFEAWIQTTKVGPQSIVRKISPFSDGFNFRLVGGVPRLTIDVTKKSGFFTAKKTYHASTFVADGDWHHVAVVVRRGPLGGGGLSGTFYVDGVAEAPFTPLPGKIDNMVDLRIGAKFDGLIDEVSIYGAPLEDCDIERIHSAGERGKCR